MLALCIGTVHVLLYNLSFLKLQALHSAPHCLGRRVPARVRRVWPAVCDVAVLAWQRSHHSIKLLLVWRGVVQQLQQPAARRMQQQCN
jgi:hypothetical protein